MKYDFQERLAFSQGARCSSDIDTIMMLLDGCESVTENISNGNDNGIDYIATLRKGAVINIDAKTRERGCSKYWRKGIPELAIEKWSVMPGGIYGIDERRAKAGWTIDESKQTHMILYTFDPSDSDAAFLLPFHHLRMAARRMLPHWMNRFKVDVQNSGSWQSQAVFVPAYEVLLAIETTYSATIPNQDNHPELF